MVRAWVRYIFPLLTGFSEHKSVFVEEHAGNIFLSGS